MAFADDFAALLADRGIPIDPADVPDPDVIGGALDNIDGFLSELDEAVRDGYDEGSLEFAVCSVLSDPTVNVAPEISTLLAAYDQVAGMRLSELLQSTREALSQVSDGTV